MTPIARVAALMRDGQDQDAVGQDVVDEVVWKAPQTEAACSRPDWVPGLRALENELKASGNL